MKMAAPLQVLTDLSPVSVVTTLLGGAFGATAAMVIGPYVVILLAAMAGAAIALLNREQLGNARFIYFIIMVVVSLLFTVPISLLLAAQAEWLNESWLFSPVAFVLGYANDKWPAIFKWLGSKLSAFVDGMIRLRTGGGNDGGDQK